MRCCHVHLCVQATVVMFPLLAIGNSKAVYGPDARDFNPQRWLRQQRGVESQQPGAAVVQPAPLAAAAAPPEPLTFMAGPRDCIGQNLAKLELQVVLATLLGRFRFGPGPELAQELAVAAATGQPPVAALHALAGVHITLQPLSGRMEFSVTPRARPDVLNE
jgi:cytochrome P450